MIIPPYSDEQGRDSFVRYVTDTCLSSRQERRQLYDRRKRYFLYGAWLDVARYNRLNAHMDLVASFLYAADHAKFSVTAPMNSNPDIVKRFDALQQEWNNDFRDSGIAYMYDLALLWALVYDTVILKPGWNEASNQELFAKMIMPYNFGVYEEDIVDIDDQEAFVHVYSINYDNAVQRLQRAGKTEFISKLTAATTSDDTLLPPILQNLLIAQTGGANLSGNIIGQANIDYEPMATYEPKISAPSVEMKETWVWDDAVQDYAIFTMMDNDLVMSDSRQVVDAMRKQAKAPKRLIPETSSNFYLPGEHAFVAVTPYKAPEYFWGVAAIDKLIPLQQWTNERLDQIHDILDRQADPAKVFSGFMGLSDEKAGALGGPGTWVLDQMPNATVKELAPEMPPDLFQEVTAIGQIFMEASGLTETTAGHGEAGVRSRGHAKQLSQTGSGRIRKVAVAQEEPLAKLAHLGLKLKMRNDDSEILGEEGIRFYAAQLASSDWKVRIAGHSNSPLFSDDAKEMAIILMKAQAIDAEMLIRLLDPPNADSLVSALKERQKKQAQQTRAAALIAAAAKGKQKGATNGTSRPSPS